MVETMRGTTVDRLQQQLTFILEIDKLKQIFRQTLLIDQSRRENDAEHSWHLAMMAILLAEYAPEKIDLLRVVKLVLVHDLVEIDAGDTFCYDAVGVQNQAAREQQAADRLFGLLPSDQAQDLRALWDEFEQRQTPEARFAAALDRLQPILHNYHTGGGTWRRAGVTVEKVRQRIQPIGLGSPQLGEFAEALVRSAVEKGFIA